MEGEEEPSILELCNFCGQPKGSSSPCLYCLPETINAIENASQVERQYRSSIKNPPGNINELYELYGVCSALFKTIINSSQAIINNPSSTASEKSVASALSTRLCALDFEFPGFHKDQFIGQATFFTKEVLDVITDANNANKAIGRSNSYNDDFLIAVLAREKYAETSEILNRHGVSPMGHLWGTYPMAVDQWLKALNKFLDASGYSKSVGDIDTQERALFRPDDAFQDRKALNKFLDASGYSKSVDDYLEPETKKEESEEDMVRLCRESCLGNLIAECASTDPGNPITPLKILEYILTSGEVNWSFYERGIGMENDLLTDIRKS